MTVENSVNAAFLRNGEAANGEAAHYFDPIDYNKVQVLDGGMGSLMEVLGYKPDTITWGSGANVDKPKVVVEAHAQFIKAGADLLLTNTYQANITRLRDSGHAQPTIYTEAGVECALRAVQHSQRDVRIVGSVGPYATYLCDGSEYTGAYLGQPGFDHEKIKENYRLHALTLKNLGVKTLAFETIPTALESRYAREIMEELEVSGWVCAVCKDGQHLANGDKFVDFVRNVADSDNVQAIGINCTSPKYVKELLLTAQPFANGKPFVVYPNSGEYYDKEQSTFYGVTSIELILKQVLEWTELGAKVVGGCCRVTPDDIRAIADKVHH